MHKPLFRVGKLSWNKLMGGIIGQYDHDVRNAIERCALSGVQKHTTKEYEGFYSITLY